MLEFNSITYKTAARVRSCYRGCEYRVSDYSLGMKLMWKTYFHPEVAFACGCMIVKNTFGGKTRFDYPVPETEDADINAALTEIERYCMEKYIPLVFYAVPEDKVGALTARYRRCRTESTVFSDEYMYNAGDMISFSGKHYSGQRNHINKFYKLFPTAKFRPLTPADRPETERFFERFTYSSEKTGRGAETELKRAKETLMRDISWCCGGCMELDGKIIALSLGEICGDTMIIHIEKALHEYEGVYPATVSAFAERFCGGVKYINREEDTGDSGLRRSKMQYRPKFMQKKYDVYVETELCAWEKIPTLKTERLTLSPLTDSESEEYFRLCTDDDRNRYWGYDYRDDCKNPDVGYFTEVARADFASGTAVNFAIKYGRKFIGEVILYDFDYHGGAQVGVRVVRGCDGRGFGKESVSAVTEEALYGLGLSVVYAKCYKENVKSQRMLSACMQKTGEDGEFVYFERRI